MSGSVPRSDTGILFIYLFILESALFSAIATEITKLPRLNIKY